MDLEAGAPATQLPNSGRLDDSARTASLPLQDQIPAPKKSESSIRPEFFVIVSAGSAVGHNRPTVLPPPEPPPIDTTDWGFFFLGWVFQLSWVVGCFRPLCRKPRFPQRQNFQGWLGNVIGTVAVVIIVVVVIILVVHRDHSAVHHKQVQQAP